MTREPVTARLQHPIFKGSETREPRYEVWAGLSGFMDDGRGIIVAPLAGFTRF